MLRLNDDDEKSIIKDIEDGIVDENYVRYDIKFSVYDTLDYINDIYRYAKDKIFPIADNGYAMNYYDVLNLFADELGIKIVSKDDPEGMNDQGVFESLLQTYYKFDVVTDATSAIRVQTMSGGVTNTHNIRINATSFNVDFLNPDSDANTEHKNKLTLHTS